MMRPPRMLLIGPYDPHCGEYTFLAPPLGVWRLAGVLEGAGVDARVFDPNCCDGPVARALERELLKSDWDCIGVSTTGMTLRFDLELAHLARRLAPRALMIAGGMEATFQPELMFHLGPFDRVALGEGERPLLELAKRLRAGTSLNGIAGTAERTRDGQCLRLAQRALDHGELRDAIFSIPYEKMPFGRYWHRLEEAYRVGALPTKAAREARLAEIRSVRLITLNYCPMGCSFCSSTNFLHEAQGSVAGIARLDAGECVQMIQRIVGAHPRVRTIIFQDDIFVFTKDRRILPLCEALGTAKLDGSVPPDLQFISTNRVDAMSHERLAAMRQVGFRVLGFGIESFSRNMLREFNKAHIHDRIRPTLMSALQLRITPFLDLILSSPRASLEDVATTLREAYCWLRRGCEIGIYPYVIPFSGAAMAADPALKAYTVHEHRSIAGTPVSWEQPSKILPIDPLVAATVLHIERAFDEALLQLQPRALHLPSRLRSLLWIMCSLRPMAAHGWTIADEVEVRAELESRLPQRSLPPAAVGFASA
ncbi:MAG: B12-binding domain-containing radical SAM protein [Gammaproteobacteria bacterium]|nr:B12-binding domain-containing radical SAM protein [Gammaproteobacteria bacterium]MDE2250187.1 B12-binding domain-containing radical SAM protein [Gammaproteobacteria bacterium]